MSEFDDAVLRDQLQRLGGHYPDDDAAYALLHQRVTVAKRRRMAAALGGLAAISVLAFGAIAFNNRETHHLVPAASSVTDETIVTDPSVSSTIAKSESAPTTTIESTTSSTDAPTTTEAATSSVPDTQAPDSLPAQPPAIATVPSKGHTSPTPSTSPPSKGVAPTAKTYRSNGGSITVAVSNGKLVLIADTPKLGYTQRVDRNEPDRIRVRFVSGNGDRSRITVSLVNGKAVASVEENTEPTGNTFHFPNDDTSNSGRGSGSGSGSGESLDSGRGGRGGDTSTSNG